MNFKSDFMCDVCKKILKNPVTLPCLCSEICEYHVDDLISKNVFKINCQICEKMSIIPQKGFTPNIVVRNFIEKNGHLLDEEKELKNDLTRLIDDLEMLIDDFKLKLREFTLLHSDHFAEIRRNIDIRRETLIMKINQISQIMIARVEEKEESLMKNIPKLNGLITNNERIKLLDIFRSPTLPVKEIEDFKNEHTSKINDMITKSKILEQMKLDIQNYKFESNFTFETESFGYLDLNESFQNLITCYFNSGDINIWNLNTSSIISTLSGHLDGIWCIKVYQNTKLISGSRDKTIRIWNLQSGECIRMLSGHTDEVLCLKILENDFLASGSNDESIKLWSLTNGNLINTLNGHTSWVYCLEQLPNGNLVSGSNDNYIKIWDLISGVCINTLESHTDWVCCLKFLNNDRLVSGSADNTVKIWDFNTGECLQTLYGHSSLITDLELTQTNQIISSSYDKRIKIWNLTDGNFIKTLTGHKSFVNCIKVNTDGKLYSGSEDKTIKVWNLKTNECVQTIKENSAIWDLELTTIYY